MIPPKIFEARKAQRFLSTLAFGLICGASAANAANIAPLGTGRLGVNIALDSTFGTPIFHTGTPALINDGLTNDGVDTFTTAPPNATVSFVGITWATPRTEQITSLTLTMETFFDGGWFGPNNSGPGNGGTLTPAFLSDATVQFSSSPDPTAVAGVWTNTPATSNYLSVLNGHVIGNTAGANPTVPPAATWTLSSPVTGITGIRLIGPEGGAAAAQGGFIGVRELVVDAIPEPSTALTLICGAVCVGARRRAR